MRGLLQRGGRLWHVIKVLTRYFVVPALAGRRVNDAAGPARMRAAFAELGGAWLKLGQMLAMRFDLLPSEYCDELLKLLNMVPPFAYEAVSRTIREELGAAPEQVFATFEPRPFASASIGQVHRAQLVTGERVAVKVQRPGIRETMRADIGLMYAAASVFDWIRIFGATPAREVIDEFSRWTADELDYVVEAHQSALLFEHARNEPLEHVARVFRGFSTSRVLTTELLEGIPLVDIVLAVRTGNTTFLNELAARGYDLRRIVLHLDWNALNQVFVYGYFHADLHPANLIVLPGDVIGYVDFGMVGQMADAMRESLTRYTWLVFQRDIEAAVHELMRWLAPTAETDVAHAHTQLARLHEGFLFAMEDAGPSMAARKAHNPYSQLALDIMQTVRQNRLSVSASIVIYLRMLVMLGTLRYQLAADYDLPSVARRFFTGLLRQKAAEWLDPRVVVARAYAASYRLQRTLDFVEFVQEQQPLLAGFAAVAYGTPARLRALRRRAISLGLAVLVVGTGLYFTLADPDVVRRVTPPEINFEWVHPTLLGLLLVLVLALADQVRRINRA